jgi:protoheme IX farnesyltransferase
MLTVADPDGRRTASRMIAYCIVLTAISLIPVVLGTAGRVYLCAALTLGLGFLLCAVGFVRTRSVSRARRVLQASLVYLPVLLGVLMWDRH